MGVLKAIHRRINTHSRLNLDTISKIAYSQTFFLKELHSNKCKTLSEQVAAAFDCSSISRFESVTQIKSS